MKYVLWNEETGEVKSYGGMTQQQARHRLSEDLYVWRRIAGKQKFPWHIRKESYSVQKKRYAKRPAMNPPAHTLGRIVEIRYERTTGRKPGFYKHVFKKGSGELIAGTDARGRKIITIRKP